MTHARSKYIMDMTGWRAEVTFYSYPVVIFAFSRRWYTLDFPSPLNRAWIFAWTSLRRGQLATTVFGGDLPWRELEIKRKIGHSEEWLVNCYLFLSLSFFPPRFFLLSFIFSPLFLTCKKCGYGFWRLEVKFVSSDRISYLLTVCHFVDA